MKIDYKTIGITMILALALATIINVLLAEIWSIDVLSLGKAWIIMLISIFIVYFFVAVSDGKINKQEIITMIIIGVALFLSGWALKNFVPEIFSVFPDKTQELFSSMGVK